MGAADRRARWGLCAVLGAATGVSIACALHNAFACDGDSDCVSAGVDGQCEDDGWCSFPDTTCASGQRYGEHSGDGLADTCVPVDMGTTGVATTDPSTTIATTMDPSSSVTLDTGVETTGGETTVGVEVTGVVEDTGSAEAPETGGSTDTGTPLDPDLHAWWKLDDEPGDGVLDSSSYGHDGSCMPCPTVAPGQLDQAYEFDGMAAQYVTVQSADDLQPDAITVTAWIMPQSASYEHTIIEMTTDQADHPSWRLYMQGQSPSVCVSIESQLGGNKQICRPLDGPNEWRHAALVFDGVTMLIYVDAVMLDQNDSNAISYGPGQITIGASVPSGLPPQKLFLGDIDDVRIYSRALTADELALVMLGG